MKLSRFAALSSSLLLGAVLALTGASAAQAAETAALDYVALGDSYSSGVGAGELRQRQWRLQALHEGVSGPLEERQRPLLLRVHGLLGRPNG